jgi:hypothetical protein
LYYARRAASKSQASAAGGPPAAAPRGIRTWRGSYNPVVSSQPSVQTAPSPHPAAPASGALSFMAADMAQVDAVIQRRLASDVALIDQIAHYIISAGGKRIRPMLVLLFSKALGFTGPERFELAATVEFIHTAT